MKQLMKLSLLAALALLTFAPAASARGRIIVGGGFGYYGPAYYGWYGPAWYGPGWYGPYGGPYGYYPGYYNSGNVKIVTHMKGNQIFVDGGFAGVTGKLKKFPLRPGKHTIEVRDRDGRRLYSENIEVIRGKTIEIRPDYNG